jgi:DNA-binding MarR family transcriptional regulator
MAAREDVRPREVELDRIAAFRAELRRFLLHSNSVTAEAGLSAQRCDLMLAIRSAGELRITELCDLLQLEQTAVTRLVKRAEGAGLIERRASDEDGRVTLLRLTAAGEAVLVEMMTKLHAETDALAEALRRVDARLQAVGP